jgi:hypothetical protein
MPRVPVIVLAGAVAAAAIWTASTLIASSASPARTCSESNGAAHPLQPCPVLVLGRPTSLTVTVYRWPKTGSPRGPIFFRRGSTHRAKTVAEVVAVLNRVDPVAPGAILHSCPAHADRHDLQFGYSNGDRWTVCDDGCWGFFTHGQRGTALGDPAVYKTIYRLIDPIAGVVVPR